MQSMACDTCGKGPATVHVTEIVEGEKIERHLCEECARKQRAEHGLLGTLPDAGRARGVCVPDDLADQARAAVARSAEVKRRFAEQAAAAIARAAELVVDCLGAGGKVLLCGNGGSAADAQHIAGELVGRFKLERPAFAAVALTTDTSILTAVANDYGFDEIFARQVEGLGRQGDVLLAYSTSGSSPNVVKAIEKAKAIGMQTIGLTGAGGGRMAELCHLCIKAPADDTPTIQECHAAAGHTICLLAERLLCGGDEQPAGVPG